MTETIYKIISDLEYGFLNTPAKIMDGWHHNQLETVKDIQRSYAGKFKSGNTDEFGYKYFYKQGKPRVKNAAKNLDLDSKDVGIKAALPKDYYKAWLMRRDNKLWMKERKLGMVFNSMVSMTPKYGSFVLKKVSGKEIVREVPLKNIKNDPSAKSIKDSWVIEDHFYTPWELKKENKKRGWDLNNINKAIASFREHGKENYVDKTLGSKSKGNAEYIHVKEFTGEVPENVYDENGDENNFILVKFIVISAQATKSQKDVKDGLILDKNKLTVSDYKDVHFDREEGRWLGVGIIEDLFDSQIMKNEQINLLMMGLRLSNLILLQTGDETVARNILTDLVNGDIVKVKEQIRRIDTRNHGTSEGNVISQEIEALANALANSFEVTTGETLPSGTPFSLGALMERNANKLFDFVRENLGMFMEEVYTDWIIPELEKDLNKKHILELVDKDEMDWLTKRFNSAHILSKIKDFILATGRKPTRGEVEMAQQVMEQRMAGKESFPLNIPDDFYDFKKSVVVDITGESENKNVTIQSILAIMQLVNSNPAALETPAMKKAIDVAGYSTVDFRVPQMAPKEEGQINELAQVAPQLAPQQPGV